jgi:hypothetical protein
VFGVGRLCALVVLVKSGGEVDTEVALPCWSVAVGGRVAPERALFYAIAQFVPVWCRPRTVRRRRFKAATRWCSHWLLRATPR